MKINSINVYGVQLPEVETTTAAVGFGAWWEKPVQNYG
jgi:hypothetical protein